MPLRSTTIPSGPTCPLDTVLVPVCQASHRRERKSRRAHQGPPVTSVWPAQVTPRTSPMEPLLPPRAQSHSSSILTPASPSAHPPLQSQPQILPVHPPILIPSTSQPTPHFLHQPASPSRGPPVVSVVPPAVTPPVQAHVQQTIHIQARSSLSRLRATQQQSPRIPQQTIYRRGWV